MSHQDILATIKSLPKDEQYAIATSILDQLTDVGCLPVSNAMKAELERREKEFDENPNEGQAWDDVRAELFDQ